MRSNVHLVPWPYRNVRTSCSILLSLAHACERALCCSWKRSLCRTLSGVARSSARQSSQASSCSSSTPLLLRETIPQLTQPSFFEMLMRLLLNVYVEFVVSQQMLQNQCTLAWRDEPTMQRMLQIGGPAYHQRISIARNSPMVPAENKWSTSHGDLRLKTVAIFRTNLRWLSTIRFRAAIEDAACQSRKACASSSGERFGKKLAWWRRIVPILFHHPFSYRLTLVYGKLTIFVNKIIEGSILNLP